MSDRKRPAGDGQPSIRSSRTQLALGALLIVGVVAAVTAVLTTGKDGDSKSQREKADQTTADSLAKAANSAGCSLKNLPEEGSQHTEKKVVYRSNPPTSGDHHPRWVEDGIYPPGRTPPTNKLVHTLEHGRINIQYRPGTDRSGIEKLKALYRENDGYHALLFENNTGMPYAVSATAWTHLLGCKDLNDRSLAAIRAFRSEYTDKGPELVP